MSTESMKKIVRRFNAEVIESGERSSFDELVDSGFINRSAPPGTPNGPESMWTTFENVLRPALRNLRVEIFEQLCEGDKVVTRKRISGRHYGMLLGVPPTERIVVIDVIDIVRIRNGRYVEHWGINTLHEALDQLRS